MLRVITWNTARRKQKAAEQCRWLSRRVPDLVALQEVTPTTLPLLEVGLRESGLVNCVHSLGEIQENSGANRTYGVLIASRFPVESMPNGIRAPWPEKALSVLVRGGETDIEVHTAYIPPGSSNGWIKIDTLEAVYEGMARRSARLRLLCGDFNTPQLEFSDGTVVTWAQYLKNGEVKMRKRIRRQPADRWDSAERGILEGLSEYGLVDAYRHIHGYSVNAYSWVLVRRDHPRPRRFDHIFATPELNPVGCEYLHEAREMGLSDHAPLLGEFSISVDRPSPPKPVVPLGPSHSLPWRRHCIV